jgi:hypothetical protein
VRITALMGAEILLAPHQTGGCTSTNPHTFTQIAHVYDKGSWTREGMQSGKTYTMCIRAKHSSGILSPPSAYVTTTAQTTFPAGIYVFQATVADTWIIGPNRWLGHEQQARNELTSGNAMPLPNIEWGMRVLVFAGYRETTTGKSIDEFFASHGGNVTVRVQQISTYIARKNTVHGLNEPVLARWRPHHYTSIPSQAPVPDESVAPFQGPRLVRGQAEYVTLPSSWSTKFFHTSSGAAGAPMEGLALGYPQQTGYDYTDYMVHPSLADEPRLGELRFHVW